MRSLFRWLFSWKVLRRGIIAALILLVVFFVAALVTLFVVNSRGAQRWHDYEVAAKERGVRLNFDDFIPAPVADEENFAATPVFTRLARAKADGEPVPLAEIDFGGSKRKPTLSEASTGKRTDLAKWVQEFEPTEVAALTAEMSSQEGARQLLKILKHFDPILAELDEAAKRPGVHFALNWQAGDIDLDMAHLSLIQKAAWIHSLRSDAQLALGDGESALRDLRSVFALRRVLEREPTVIPALVRLTITSHVWNILWEGILTNAWTDSQLDIVGKELAKIDIARDYRFMLESQRAATNRMFEIMIDRNAPGRAALERALAGGNEVAGTSKSRLRYLPLLRGWVRGNQWRMNLYFDELLSVIDKTRGNIRPKSPNNSPLLQYQNMAEFYQYLLFKTAGPVYSMMDRRFAYGETFKRMAQIACALERYRLRNGQYPTSLELLAPDFMETLPKECLVDADFHYEITLEKSFRLYSVGLNLADDGGVIVKRGKPPKSSNSFLDWVWSPPEPGQSVE